MVKDFTRIVVAVDGSESARKAAKRAISLAKYMNVKILAVYVVDTSSSFIPMRLMSAPVEDFLKKQGRTYLAEVRKMAKEAGVEVTAKVLTGIPFEQIADIGKRNDLIVLGSKGKTAADRILIGSVSDKVVRHAKCPVLVVK